MTGDAIACPLMLAQRGLPLRCDIDAHPVTGVRREIKCRIGIGGTCPWPARREAEIRRRERAAWVRDVPASVLVDMERRGMARGLGR